MGAYLGGKCNEIRGLWEKYFIRVLVTCERRPSLEFEIEFEKE